MANHVIDSPADRSADAPEGRSVRDLPHYYDIAFDWDITAEVAAFEALFAEHASRPIRRLLELGSGSGRFLRAFAARGYDILGIDVNEQMVVYASARQAELGLAAGRCQVADMAGFDLGQRFDAAICSANTFRHLCSDEQIRSAWNALADHILPGGVFIADLELIIEPEKYPVGKWDHWSGVRDDVQVRMGWRAVGPGRGEAPTMVVEASYDVRRSQASWTVTDRFELRNYTAEQFAQFAEVAGFGLVGWYEVRFPWFFPIERPDRNVRVLAVASRRGEGAGR